mmetsp:Transcript_4665/g.6904  ORF Transcript_4665/g.6904 Transcript_4665/m.6904 type:complete len:593 (-) Transcript_4665:155-1933(-)|eukprot:CAMPEP_0172430450 /NCGR_PEP_ID=MMETSP1064-20121228/54513_1 /TAXON_ID=202472 /ORGANISM="Aulacoseira subarctica , Strain CCAP 1002/5" /LENGTH=592 /DNA_ID=CAMNT_0013176507 /DNA_START=43 /DNA_END=1821 /DNA_ORIENTATION=-
MSDPEYMNERKSQLPQFAAEEKLSQQQTRPRELPAVNSPPREKKNTQSQQPQRQRPQDLEKKNSKEHPSLQPSSSDLSERQITQESRRQKQRPQETSMFGENINAQQHPALQKRSLDISERQSIQGPRPQKQRPQQRPEKSISREYENAQGEPSQRQKPTGVTENGASRGSTTKPQRPRQQEQLINSQKSRRNNEQRTSGSNAVGSKSVKPSKNEPVSAQYQKSRENARGLQQDQQEKRRSEQYKKGRTNDSKKSRENPNQRGSDGCCLFFEIFVDTTCNLICLGVVVIIAVICGVIIYKMKTGKDAPLVPGIVNDVADGAIMDFSDLFKKGLVDSWQNNGTGEFPTAVWSHSGNGLKLDVYNALTSDWYPYFTVAINDWANGHSPTSLVLPTVIVAADPSCTPVDGVLKVCNADFGETGWKGINEVAINGLNHIVQSVAKMNEYYLSGAADGEKQYTMCHETGHGFGLGHQDEDFYNKDLGTCMDYVLDPQNNQHPNDKDYSILSEVYGVVQGRIRDRERRTLHLRSNGKSHQNEAPSPYFISFTDKEHRHRWRLLKKMEGMETHELDLGDGNKMRAHLMLADRNGTIPIG